MPHPWIALAVALLVTACSATGRNFERPSSAQLALGKTTVAEAISAFGEPAARRVDAGNTDIVTYFDEIKPRPAALRRAVVRGDIVHLRYTHSYATMAPAGRASARFRLLELAFWNDRLIYYLYSSSFAEDATDFDESRVPALVRGRTTRTDVLNQLGPPGGQAVYPHIARHGGRLYLYQYAIVEPQSGRLAVKHLQLLFNAADRLEEVYLATERTPDEPKR
ncbi:MAG: hypothetical protein KIT25_04585 [Enhydrobacter sp.]|nr:MAG: hypothetical protein KIT25_04585 [Enhydrobacter sp.]